MGCGIIISLPPNIDSKNSIRRILYNKYLKYAICSVSGYKAVKI